MSVEMLDRIRKQMDRAMKLPYYQKRYREAGFEPGDLKSWEDFQKLPFTSREEQAASMIEAPPLGTLYHPDTVLITHTPAPGVGLLPEYYTAFDLRTYDLAVASAMRLAGITAADLVQVMFGYSPFIGAFSWHGGVQALGAKVINAGAGDTERQVEFIKRLGVGVLITQPSFGEKLAGLGAPSPRIFISAGEPFSSIEGRRERLENAFAQNGQGRPITIDAYGTSGFAVVSMECPHHGGLHIMEDWAYLEIIDPETGKNVPEGTNGEIVLTHVAKEGMPLMRFRTGDLAVQGSKRCACGLPAGLPNGVFGRASEMYRIKGVKVYPSSVAFVLAGVEGVSPRDFRLHVTRPPGDTDRLTVIVKGDPSVASGEVIRQKLAERILIRPDVVSIVAELEPGPVVLDERGGLDR